MREEDLREPVASFMSRSGLRVYHEVPINGRVADLVGVGDPLMAVELKLSNWKQGLRQAMSYQLACPVTFLCLPFEKALGLLRKAYYLQREGVGLLGYLPYRDEVRTLLPARESGRHLPYMEDFLRRRLTGALGDSPPWASHTSDLTAIPLREVGDALEGNVTPRLEEGEGFVVPFLHQGRDDASTSLSQRHLRMLEEASSNTPSPVVGMHREAIDPALATVICGQHCSHENISQVRPQRQVRIAKELLLQGFW